MMGDVIWEVRDPKARDIATIKLDQMADSLVFGDDIGLGSWFLRKLKGLQVVDIR